MTDGDAMRPKPGTVDGASGANGGADDHDPAAATATEGGAADAERELAAARAELAEIKDRWVRERADLENYKRRAVKEKQDALKAGLRRDAAERDDDRDDDRDHDRGEPADREG